jgi:peptide/nickel transport system permease protein
MANILNNLRELRRYPSAIAGLAVILLMVLVSIYTMITIPYSEGIRLWRGGPGVWSEYPRNAWPVWYNWFTAEKYPESLIIRSREAEDDDRVTSLVETGSGTTRQQNILYTFDFDADRFPLDVALFYQVSGQGREPFIEVTWITPDGREIRGSSFSARGSDSYRFNQDSRIQRGLERSGVVPDSVLRNPDGSRRNVPVETWLFAQPQVAPATVLKGDYQVRVEAQLFDDQTDLETSLVVYGQLYGWAGTDHLRRDLMIALLWGTPIALAFGLLAAVGTTLITMTIAAVGVWYGGILDALIQRLTQVVIILPTLPILIMVATFWSRSIWLMLGVIILLGIFGSGIIAYRSVFLQVKEAHYIDAARAYGASNSRIIFRYLMPRILPVLIPGFVSGVPAYVFLEASLALLGLGDPQLPTWGKIINDAYERGALFTGYYYWVLEPAVLLMTIGFAFALLGFALDRVFNPRLREL